MEKIRWGILSTARVATSFVESLKMVPDAEVVAVGSRSLERAKEFGGRFDIPHCHGSYEELVRDPDVDIVYVCTPHVFHHDHVMLCLDGNKHVLCEKPFTLNAVQASRLVRTARAKDLFLMEGMWMRFFPVMQTLRASIRVGTIGDIKMMRSGLSMYQKVDPEDRLFKKELGGGALLDLGVFPISLTSMFLGKPQDFCGFAELGSTGVDMQAACTFTFPNGVLAVLSVSFLTSTPQETVIYGTRGSIRLHTSWLCPSAYTIAVNGSKEVVEMEYEGSGYQFEVQAIHKALKNGKTESEIMPLDESVDIMRTLDQLRNTWGLSYPGEE